MPVTAPWIPTSQVYPCPICGRSKRGNRCFLIPGEVAICYYDPAGLYRKTTAGDAWLHFLKERPERERPIVRHVIVRGAVAPPNRQQLARLAGKFQLRLTPDRLRSLSQLLGISCSSLKRLSAGWTAGEPMYVASRGEERAINAWSFPRHNAGRHVTGISLRPQWGKKFAWAGSTGGLHIPDGFQPGGRGFCCEGPSDTAACLDFGLNAFGRTSCSSDVDHVLEFIQLHNLQQFIIFSQRDEAHYRTDGSVYFPAQDGAEELASKARRYVPDVRVIMPPAHEGDKDVRDWLRRGGTAAEVEQLVIESAPRAMRIAVSIFRKKGNGVCHTKTN